jgi:hypothetical protein
MTIMSNHQNEGSSHLAGTIQPQIVPDAIESVRRNELSLNPENSKKSAVTIEAVKTRLK